MLVKDGLVEKNLGLQMSKKKKKKDNTTACFKKKPNVLINIFIFDISWLPLYVPRAITVV